MIMSVIKEMGVFNPGSNVIYINYEIATILTCNKTNYYYCCVEMRFYKF